ncbi:hypothetical protein [Flavobacterium saccharophilum]|uniref:RiboL-PSP-HEPN domain-containing protein n=1 Tax=Flavobacterium saccharophilum TaxID=29534 RepID=A0A1M7AU38_9FLAO|nr:hypothetical protein [Flavobacterium saccharophilum]SHL46242.1 hypothetical protein SAMN05444366_0807 [Flavobacterium saccharophilum]
MKKPLVIIKDHLLMPILATETRVHEIKKEIKTDTTNVVLNGLFLMLASYNESMKKEVVKYYLKYRPEKISDKTIIIDKMTLVNSEDFNLSESIIDDYLEKIKYWELSKLFYNLLSIEKPANENIIQKIVDRRNELIHKNLKINFKHKEILQDSIDELYLTNCLKEYEKYLIDIKTKVSTNFIAFSKLRALENLWHHTFQTPLCSNFSDYWYIDSEKDCISGCKHPEIVDNLSSSEKFMLGIWQSQVCGAKVDFPNMASLSKRTQNNLYLFLKLSNDLFFYS